MLDFIVTNLPILLLFLVGIVLLVVEAFIPGFGAAGICGVLAGLASIIIAWINYGAMQALGLTVVFLAILAIAVTMSLRSAAKGKLSQSKIVLNESEAQDAADLTADDMQVFIGKTGKTVTPLRPIGTADFDGVRVSVTSDGEFLDAGQEVRVIRTEGSRIIVRHV